MQRAEVTRIAVLRANGIGDLMFALPALDALRAAYPAARISLLATPWHRDFLTGRPGPVDEVLVVPVSRGVREDSGREEDPEELEQFFAEMRRRRFDLAVQLHGGGGYSNPFTARLGAKRTVGLRDRGAAALDSNVPYIYYQSEVLRLIEVARAAGAEPVTLEPRLQVVESDLRESEVVVSRSEKPLAALNAGAGDPRRRWPPAKFAAVGDELARSGARVVLVGSRDDRELAGEVERTMRHPLLNVAGELGLGGLAGLLSRCALVVSNDSGPLHLAAAVGSATVGIFWCGNMINAGPAFRSSHRPQISWRLQCPVCGVDCTRDQCEHEESFVAEVPVAQVSEAALELLSARARPRQPTS